MKSTNRIFLFILVGVIGLCSPFSSVIADFKWISMKLLIFDGGTSQYTIQSSAP